MAKVKAILVIKALALNEWLVARGTADGNAPLFIALLFGSDRLKERAILILSFSI